MAIQSNFPAIRPSLLLDFANSKRLDPRITFTRASTARYYDGVTVAKAEENMLTRSQAFDEAAWVKGRTSVTADQTTAPDGTSTADLMASNTENLTHTLARTGTVGTITSGLAYTFSVFMKKGTGATAPDWMQLTFAGGYFGTTQYANFNLTTGAVGATAGTITASIVNAGGGWYRCIITATATASGSTGTIGGQIAFTNNNDGLGRLPSYVDATTSDVFLWGAQLEQRSAATAYTATTTDRITNYVPQLLTAQNNVARFDHDPITGESLGLLIEESRTNLALQSEAFGTTWTATRATVMNNTRIAPDGTLTSDSLIDTTDNNTHFVSQTFTGTAAAYTFSVYVKAAGYNFVALRLFNGTSEVGLAYYNLSTGATGTVSSGTASIVNVGNGWYRCILTATLAASASCTADIQLASADGTNSFAGDGWKSVALWGAQVELGAFATSYIPTVAATVTRSADAASMTGTNFSSWYDAAEGTVYTEASMMDVSSTAINAFASISAIAGDVENYIRTGRRVGGGAVETYQLIVETGNVVQAFLQTGTVFSATNTFYRVASAYKTDDMANVEGGGTVGTDTSGIMPSTVANLYIGTTGTSGFLNGRMKKLAYYPLRLTNAQLQAITG